MTIGVFDSGIGGLSLLWELSRRLPETNFIYYADSKNAPYGEKTPDEIYALTERALQALIERGVSAVVLACNTATSTAAKGLRAAHTELPIFGMEPAINQAAKTIKDGKILATATPVTLRGEKYQALVERIGAEERTIPLPLPRLVRLAEQKLFVERQASCDGGETYIREALASANIDTDALSAVVLGCTHFVFFTNDFRRIFPELPIFNGVDGTASNVIRTLNLTDATQKNDENCANATQKISAASTVKRTDFLISGTPAEPDEIDGFYNCLCLLERQ